MAMKIRSLAVNFDLGAFGCEVHKVPNIYMKMIAWRNKKRSCGMPQHEANTFGKI
jgi:hypothetical protein